jgi:ABC-type lipoprotein export system ATPase subunit
MTTHEHDDATAEPEPGPPTEQLPPAEPPIESPAEPSTESSTEPPIEPPAEPRPTPVVATERMPAVERLAAQLSAAELPAEQLPAAVSQSATVRLPGVESPTEELPAALVLAAGLGLRGRRGWIYQGVDLRLAAGSVTALVGPAGSGRSMLLLTLAGRAKPTAGRLTVGGELDRQRIRRVVAVARVTSAVELEPEMHVIDHIREAELLTGGDYRRAATTLGLDLDPTALVADLAADDAVLFATALALAGRPRVIVVDDVDIAATPTEQHRIWAAFHAAGVAVIASSVDGRVATDAGAAVVSVADERSSADARA